MRLASRAALLVTVAACSLSGLAFAVHAQDQAGTPVLRIASPFAGPLWRTDVDAGENYFAVSSAYKSVAVWNIDPPTPPLFSRLPLRPEQSKRAHAIAISPNGELVAYSVPPLSAEGGSFRPRTSVVYVLRRGTDEIVQVLNRTSDDIVTRPQAMRFSPDGELLAAVLSSGCGLRVWSTRRWELVARDDQGYGGDADTDRCCRGGDTSSCDSLPDGNSILFAEAGTAKSWLITSADTGVRSYEVIGTEVALRAFVRPQEIDLDRPAGLSLNPDGTAVVVGDRRDATKPGPIRWRAAVLDRQNLRPRGPPLEIKESALIFGGLLQGGPALGDFAQFSMDRVAWLRAPSTEYIFATSVPCQVAATRLVSPPAASDIDVCMVRWDLAHLDEDPIFIPVGIDRVAEILPLNQRGGVLVASQKLIALLAPDGTTLRSDIDRVLVERNAAADFRGAELPFAMSPDGQTVLFDDYRGIAGAPIRVVFDLQAVPHPIGAVGSAATIAPDQDPNVVVNWRNSQAPPRLAGMQLTGSEYQKDETYRSVALLQSRKLALLGSSDFIRLIDYSGNDPVVLCRVPIREEAYRVNISPDGGIAVTAHSDGTLRWHHIEFKDSGCAFQSLLSVYLSKTSSEKWTWIAWRPDGRHAQDFDANTSLEWQLSAPDGTVTRTPFERLQRWYDRDAIRNALAAAPSAAPNLPKSQAPNASTVASRARAPNVIDVSPNPPRRATKPNIRVGIRIGDDAGWPKKVSVRANNTLAGIAWHGAAGSEVIINRDDLTAGSAEIEISLPPTARTVLGDVQLCFYVNGERDTCHVLAWTGELLKPRLRRLWGVFVGLSRYGDPRLNLRFAENDAIDLARLFVRDHDARSKSSRDKPFLDYGELHINLAIGASPEGQKEINDILSARSYVKSFPPTREGIISAVNDINEQRATNQDGSDLGDDLFVFYFSGHGLIVPTERDHGRTILTTANFKSDAPADEIEKANVTTSELWDLFERMPGEKLIVIDACRSLTHDQNGAPFDPTAVKQELATRGLTADVFFSSDAAQASREVAGLAYERTRSSPRQGNSLFTYALLRALTTREAVLPGAQSKDMARVRIDAINLYFQSVFFNTELPDSFASCLKRSRQWSDVQTPKFSSTRGSSGSRVVRTLIADKTNSSKKNSGAACPP
jgi:WD40 repeat protein